MVDEAVLRRVVGGPDVIAEQITHVVRLLEAGWVRLRVLPYGVGAYQLLQSMLTLM
ncbi:Scr1 family TA system antitoxin-like transcriptional regulator [Streptomyces phytohabitans]|uniref:Scr1 family TA system antitoxin-like transcriptional regulator n=1 Tax=Streptomyces phytohabitans TaxID=1150371 RepID=UPI00345C530B